MFQVKYVNQLDNWSENAAQCPQRGQERLVGEHVAKLQREGQPSSTKRWGYVVVKH